MASPATQDLCRISIRYGEQTVDLAVPGALRIADVVASGGFPAGTGVIGTDGTVLAADARIAEVLDDGAIIALVERPIAPTLSRLPVAAGSDDDVVGPPVVVDPAPSGPAPAPPPATTTRLDPAGAGGRLAVPAARPTRAATRAAARDAERSRHGRPGRAMTGRARDASRLVPSAGPAAGGPRPAGAPTPVGFDAAARRAVSGRVALLAAVVTAATAVAVVVLTALPSTAGTGLPRWAALAASLPALAAAVFAARTVGTDDTAGTAVRIAAVPVGAAGGTALGLAVPFSLGVAATLGLAVGTGVAMLARAGSTRTGGNDPRTSVAAATAGIATVLAAVSVAGGWAGWVAPLLAAGATPLVLRALPVLALDVDDEQLIDVERLSNTSWSARIGIRRRRRPIHPTMVAAVTDRATGFVEAGTAALTGVAVVGYGASLVATDRGELAGWAGLASGVLLATSFALAGRTVRNRRPRLMLRLAAALVAVETAVVLFERTGPGGLVPVTTGSAVVGLAIVTPALLLAGGGGRSLRISRLADVAEGFCVVMSLPAALLAVDAFAVLWRASS